MPAICSPTGIYHGPVIYCEGPYMNARDAYYRIIAGDYLGMRTIQGPERPQHLPRLRLRCGEGRAEVFWREVGLHFNYWEDGSGG